MAKNLDFGGAARHVKGLSVAGVQAISRVCPERECIALKAALFAYWAVPHITLSVVLLLAAAGCRPEGKREAARAPLPLTLAVQPAPYSGLIAVADEKGFFKQAGVELKIKRYASGRDSLRAMMGGEAQVGISQFKP